MNSWTNPALEGMHDIYYDTPAARPAAHPHRESIRQDRRYISALHPAKVIAVVETHSPPLRSSPIPQGLEGHRRPHPGVPGARGEDGAHAQELLPLQSGVGNLANAVMAGLGHGPFDTLTAYTEVLQDGMLHLLKQGR